MRTDPATTLRRPLVTPTATAVGLGASRQQARAASWSLCLELAVVAYWRNRPDPRVAVVALVVEGVTPDGGLVEA